MIKWLNQNIILCYHSLVDCKLSAQILRFWCLGLREFHNGDSELDIVGLILVDLGVGKAVFVHEIDEALA